MYSMAGQHPKGALDRSAAGDLWSRTVSQISSVYGRLVYLSSLRDTDTGLYRHQGLALKFGDGEADRAIRGSHEQHFAEWLNSPLARQKEDLELYLSTLSDNRSVVIDTWLRVAPYRGLAPAAARPSERDLFTTDFEHLLAALSREYTVAGPDPNE
jgi:hypothetical protein